MIFGLLKFCFRKYGGQRIRTALLSKREKHYEIGTGRVFGCTNTLSAGVRLRNVTRRGAIFVRKVGPSKK